MCYTCLDREFSVEQSNVYFTVIGQALQELWQFESRHANTRNLRAFLIHFYSRSSFLDYAGLRVKGLEWYLKTSETTFGLPMYKISMSWPII